MPCSDVIMIAFFPRNIQSSPLFARKARVNTERVPPGHPIVLLKSNKFNMAAVLVKRSIGAASLQLVMIHVRSTVWYNDSFRVFAKYKKYLTIALTTINTGTYFTRKPYISH